MIVLRKRRKGSDDDRIFIDLEGYEVEEDRHNFKARISTVEMKEFSDLTVISDLLSHDWIVVVETSKFNEGEALRREALDKMRSIAQEKGAKFSEVTERVVIITPVEVKVEKHRIRRRI